ncbi:MAG: hypothetical protein ACXVDN_23465, partial [Ktedonobacteraceae bacterium]
STSASIDYGDATDYTDYTHDIDYPEAEDLLTARGDLHRNLQQLKRAIMLSRLPQTLITVITLMLLITMITLITKMKVFQHTGLRHMNLMLHWQMLLYSTSQRREICTLRKKTYKTLKITKVITLMA